jgi:hypothetical protein
VSGPCLVSRMPTCGFGGFGLARVLLVLEVVPICTWTRFATISPSAVVVWLTLLVVTLASAALAERPCHAHGRTRTHAAGLDPFGLGFAVGAPTGLSLEMRATPWSSFELALGLDAFEDGGGHAHLVYKVTPFDLASGPVGVPIYAGLGGYVLDRDRRLDDDIEVGVRVPVGVEVDLQHLPVQLFAELAFDLPVVRLHHTGARGGLGIGACAGARWWF